MGLKAKWKLGYNTFWWEGLDKQATMEACIADLVDAGYQAVEYKVDSFGAHPNLKAIVRAAEAARNAGLVVSNLVILRNLAQGQLCDQSIADMSEAIRICGAAEIGALNFSCGGPAQVPAYPPEQWWQQPTRPDPKAWETLTKSLTALLDVAEAESVDLALEPCLGNLVHDFGSAQELLARVDHPRMKLTFDPSHFVLARQDLGVAIRRLGPNIRHVHFKDAVGAISENAGSRLFPILGEGKTDWPVFFGALNDIGYDEVVSVEFESFRFMEDVWQRDPVPPMRLSKLAADRLWELYGSER